QRAEPRLPRPRQGREEAHQQAGGGRPHRRRLPRGASVRGVQRQERQEGRAQAVGPAPGEGLVTEEERIADEFGQAVNMTAKYLESWLATDESKSVGQKDDGGESTGHESGRDRKSTR